MSKDLGSEDTKVVAVFSNRHDAEVAKSFLEDQGISSFVAADDVHVPLQLTEGARLHVMSDRGDAAVDALRDADMLPPERQHGEMTEDDTAGAAVDRPAGTVSWLYIASFLLLILAIIAAMILVNLT